MIAGFIIITFFFMAFGRVAYVLGVKDGRAAERAELEGEIPSRTSIVNDLMAGKLRPGKQ